jgi:MarR family transcriptional regulator, organic hydroperoxide resistance regulator
MLAANHEPGLKDRKLFMVRKSRVDAKVADSKNIGHDSDAFRELIALLYASIGRLQSIRRALAQHLGVEASEMATLLALEHLRRKGDVSVSAIAKHLHIVAANITSTLSRLESLGWIRKQPHAKDVRRLCITLTPKALAALATLHTKLDKVNEAWFGPMKRDELATVLAFLTRIERQFPAALHLASHDK